MKTLPRIALAIASKRDGEVLVTLTVEGRTETFVMYPHAAASLAGRLAKALAE